MARDSIRPAVALLEFDSVAVGIAAGDAMVKAAPVAGVHAGTVQPGHYLVFVGGDTASVEVAIDAGLDVGVAHLIDRVFLPDVHPAVLAAALGDRPDPAGEALGVIEAKGVAAILEAADAGVKGAAVALQALVLADGLGGKAYALFAGPVAEVEAAVEIGTGRVTPSRLVAAEVIPQLHADMAANVWSELDFHRRLAALDEG